MTARNIEQAIRLQLSQNTNGPIAEAAGWDSSAVSRFLSGQQGVTIGKLDTVVQAAGFVLVEKKYLDAVVTLAEIGMACQCARASGGTLLPGDKTPRGSQ